MRQALGMSEHELGRRLGVSQPRVSTLERAEQKSAIRLRDLERAAQALHCRLAYALVPVTRLEVVVEHQARERAAEELEARSPTARRVLGEAAMLDPALDEENLTLLAHFLVDRQGLWRPPERRSYQA